MVKWIAISVAILGLVGCAELNQAARNLGVAMPTDSGSTIIAGLKEALSVGTANAVVDVSKINGYFRNAAIKVLIPEKMQKMATTLRRVGLGKMVHDFEKSMNQAAEQAAPKAKQIFLGAIREITFDDARRILNGRDTEATNFLKTKTYNPIATAFRPIIQSSMDQVGVTRTYKQMINRLRSLRVQTPAALDLDAYVTGKALDGLFLMVSREEKKIRTDPAARVTDLLKEVFGSMRR